MAAKTESHWLPIGYQIHKTAPPGRSGIPMRVQERILMEIPSIGAIAPRIVASWKDGAKVEWRQRGRDLFRTIRAIDGSPIRSMADLEGQIQAHGPKTADRDGRFNDYGALGKDFHCLGYPSREDVMAMPGKVTHDDGDRARREAQEWASENLLLIDGALHVRAEEPAWRLNLQFANTLTLSLEPSAVGIHPSVTMPLDAREDIQALDVRLRGAGMRFGREETVADSVEVSFEGEIRTAEASRAEDLERGLKLARITCGGYPFSLIDPDFFFAYADAMRTFKDVGRSDTDIADGVAMFEAAVRVLPEMADNLELMRIQRIASDFVLELTEEDVDVASMRF